MSITNNKNKVFLLSLDGWGLAQPGKGNAVINGNTPNMDRLSKNYEQYAELDASGLFVGLPEGVMGNSEVGHLTMGSGRQKFTDLVRINSAVKEKTLCKNEVLLNAFKKAENSTHRIHFLGLVSDGGVHSHITHLFELLRCSKDYGIREAFIHFFSDGRDTSPTSGVTYVKQVIDFTKEIGYGKLASLIGRYYAMDRDKRWDRFKIAYDALVDGIGECVEQSMLIDEMKLCYKKEVFDEYMKPFVLLPNKEGTIKNGDTLIFTDFRSDRMRQIVETFVIKPPFETNTIRKDLYVVQMTEYSKSFTNIPVLFPPENMEKVLAECVSKKGYKQFHCAETEKYAHVTFFFNGGREAPFDGEHRKLIASPKVATYDMAPRMSMDQVTQSVIEAIDSNKYEFVMCNFAPPDMVGHTGNYDATVVACEATDECIGKLISVCDKNNTIMIITSDHGNAEEMIDEFGKPKTSHNTNLVPFCLIQPSQAKEKIVLSRKRGSLKDVAPTVLQLLGIDVPKEMSGESLL